MRGTARGGREGKPGKAGARSTASEVKGRRERRLKDGAIRATLRCGAPRRGLLFRVTAVFLAGQKPRPSEAHGADEW